MSLSNSCSFPMPRKKSKRRDPRECNLSSANGIRNLLALAARAMPSTVSRALFRTSVPSRRSAAYHAAAGALLCSPFRIQLRNCWRNRKVPDKNSDALVLFRNNVKISSLRRRHASFVHFLRLVFNIVEKRTEQRDSFLATDRPMSGHEDGVLVPGRERLQSLPPARHSGLRVEANWIQSGQEQIPCVHHVLFRNADDDVRPGVSRVALDHRCQSSQIHFHRYLRRL